jgi:hypothetical protein
VTFLTGKTTQRLRLRKTAIAEPLSIAGKGKRFSDARRIFPFHIVLRITLLCDALYYFWKA